MAFIETHKSSSSFVPGGAVEAVTDRVPGLMRVCFSRVTLVLIPSKGRCTEPQNKGITGAAAGHPSFGLPSDPK